MDFGELLEQKAKLIIVGLIILFVVSIAYSFSILQSKEKLEKQFSSAYSKLKNENARLADEANRVLQDKNNLEREMEGLRGEIEAHVREKDDLEDRYSILSREREELVEKLQEMSKRRAVLQAPVPIVESASEEPPVTEDVYWANVLREKAHFENLAQGLKERLDSLILKSEDLKKDNLDLKLEVKSITQESQSLEREYEYTQQLLNSLTTELVREKKEKNKINRELANLKKDYVGFVKHLKKINKEKVALEKKLKKNQEEKRKIEDKFSGITQALDSKILEIEQVKRQLEIVSGNMAKDTDLKESVELPPIVVRSQDQVEGMEADEEKLGSVLAVNQEHNFIVVDVGEDEDAAEGMVYNIFRNDQKIAVVEVIQVRDDISACDIKQQDTAIMVGDIVR